MKPAWQAVNLSSLRSLLIRPALSVIVRYARGCAWRTDELPMLRSIVLRSTVKSRVAGRRAA